MALDPRTPVLVGAAAAVQRSDDPSTTLEAAALMAGAARAAAADAGAPALLDRVELVLVPEGTWGYPDPGRLVGAPPSARTVRADVGVLQQSLLTRAAAVVASGDADVVLVCGGEAKHRALRSAITGIAAPETDQGPVEPDEVVRPAADVLPAVEIERELAWPVRQYALIEHALWAATGDGAETERRRLDELWAGFSRVAAANPLAWSRDAVTAEQLAAAPLLSSPYSKLHASQWNVDQAAALLVTSTEVADRLGVPRDRRVFPLVAVESNHMVPLTERAEVHRCPAMAVAGEHLTALGGVAPRDVDVVDLYSCFPSAVRLQCRELDVDPGRPLTVTGGMAFAGGPLNNYVLGALVALVGRLRDEPSAVGLSTSVSGMLTKFGLGTWSATPPAAFRSADVTAEVAARTPTVVVDPTFVGEAPLVAATVAHDKGAPVVAVALADTPSGGRAVATSADPETMAALLDGGPATPRVALDGPAFTLL